MKTYLAALIVLVCLVLAGGFLWWGAVMAGELVQRVPDLAWRLVGFMVGGWLVFYFGRMMVHWALGVLCSEGDERVIRRSRQS